MRVKVIVPRYIDDEIRIRSRGELMLKTESRDIRN